MGQLLMDLHLVPSEGQRKDLLKATKRPKVGLANALGVLGLHSLGRMRDKVHGQAPASPYWRMLHRLSQGLPERVGARMSLTLANSLENLITELKISTLMSEGMVSTHGYRKHTMKKLY